MKALGLALMIAIGASAASVRSGIRVGVIEDDRAELADWQEGVASRRVVLPLFRNDDGIWRRDNPAESLRWTIAMGGRKGGSFLSSREAAVHSVYGFFVFVPQPKPGQRLVLGTPDDVYSGWQETHVNRPLVVVSDGSVSDPDRWIRGHPTPAQANRFRSAFRATFDRVFNCDDSEQRLPDAWSYQDADVDVAATYHSRRGDWLVSMFLNGGRCGIPEGAFVSHQFLFPHDGAARQLAVDDTNDAPPALTFVGAGDYDGDGQSEVLFFLSSYDRDGYVLFSDRFRKSVSATWAYH